MLMTTRKLGVGLFALVVAGVMLGGCQTGSLVAEEAWMQRVSTGHAFTEGPVWDGEEHIYFTDIPKNRIYRYNVRTNRTEVAREDTGGANGLAFDRRGRLIMAQGGERRVARVNDDGEVEVLANYTPIGKRLNSPNDVDVDRRGGIYFTDPRYGDRESMEIEFEGVYYITPDGEVTLVVDDLQRPNGVLLSRDESTLYVTDEAGKTVWAYDVEGDGSVSNGRVFAWLNPDADLGGDGMTIDEQGNLYAAGFEAVWVWNEEGELLDRIVTPEGPSNVTFGGPDGRDLYITAQTSLYRLRMNVRGAR